jgi:hypothetical protein
MVHDGDGRRWFRFVCGFPYVFWDDSLRNGVYGTVHRGREKNVDVAVKTFCPNVIDVSPQWFHGSAGS